MLADAFGLGQLVSFEYLAEGLMNPNWRLHTDTGTYAAKRILDVSLGKARRNLAAPTLLTKAGLSVCSPLSTASGELVAELAADRGYCVFPWVAGAHIEGPRLSLSAVTVLGELVGRLHQALADAAVDAAWPALPDKVGSRVTTVADAQAQADRYLAVIAAINAPDRFDLSAAEDVLTRKALLGSHGSGAPNGEIAKGTVGWTHGDLQFRNLLWRNGQVVAVLDWDRVGPRPLVEELVRTAQVQFSTADGQLDLERMAAFVVGYRTVVDVSNDEIADATRRLWWKRMTDFWPLQWHYDKHDHRCDDLWATSERVLGWWCKNLDATQEALKAR